MEQFRNNHLGLIVLLVAVIGLSAIGSSRLLSPTPGQNNSVAINNLTATPAPLPTSGKANLQLQVLNFTTPSPTPTSMPFSPSNTPIPAITNTPAPPASTLTPTPQISCGIAVGVKAWGESNGQCCVVDGGINGSMQCCPGVPNQGATNYMGTTQYAGWCDAKPVIYLYPPKDTFVSVNVSSTGKIVESIPAYPKNGWQNIFAHPDGSFIYDNRIYNELFYETSIDAVQLPTNGIIVSSNELRNQLGLLVTKLGLNEKETDELINYWLPKLRQLNSPFILISIIDQQTKDLIDDVTITPAPDTFIQFNLFFKPLSSPYPVAPLYVPPTPVRNGFTAVEWGGIIDQSNSLL